MLVKQKPKHLDLHVWHIPQVPGKSFIVPVKTLVEAKIVLNALAEYDAFQFKNHIKPDYANASGLCVFDAHDDTDSPDGSWTDWYSVEGEDIDEYTLEQLRESTPETA